MLDSAVRCLLKLGCSFYLAGTWWSAAYAAQRHADAVLLALTGYQLAFLGSLIALCWLDPADKKRR